MAVRRRRGETWFHNYIKSPARRSNRANKKLLYKSTGAGVY